MYSDFHLHFSNNTLFQNNLCFSCYNQIQFEQICNFYNLQDAGTQKRIKIAFGIHPLFLEDSKIEYLENLLQNNKIDAIGEIGFDYNKLDLCTDKEQALKKQSDFWNKQIEAAIDFNKTIIVHSVKSLQTILCEKQKLKKVKAVVFHGSKIPYSESLFLLKNGINAFFSYGKTLLTENKNTIECVKKLPLEHICFETDSPFQLKAFEIEDVYKKAAEVKKIDLGTLASTTERIFFEIY